MQKEQPTSPLNESYEGTTTCVPQVTMTREEAISIMNRIFEEHSDEALRNWMMRKLPSNVCVDPSVDDNRL
jgi:hypothetical protein